MPVEDEKELARGGNRDSQNTAVPHRKPGDSSTSVPEEDDDPEWDAFMRRTRRFMNSGERR